MNSSWHQRLLTNISSTFFWIDNKKHVMCKWVEPTANRTTRGMIWLFPLDDLLVISMMPTSRKWPSVPVDVDGSWGKKRAATKQGFMAFTIINHHDNHHWLTISHHYNLWRRCVQSFQPFSNNICGSNDSGSAAIVDPRVFPHPHWDGWWENLQETIPLF